MENNNQVQGYEDPKKLARYIRIKQIDGEFKQWLFDRKETITSGARMFGKTLDKNGKNSFYINGWLKTKYDGLILIEGWALHGNPNYVDRNPDKQTGLDKATLNNRDLLLNYYSGNGNKFLKMRFRITRPKYGTVVEDYGLFNTNTFKVLLKNNNLFINIKSKSREKYWNEFFYRYEKEGFDPLHFYAMGTVSFQSPASLKEYKHRREIGVEYTSNGKKYVNAKRQSYN